MAAAIVDRVANLERVDFGPTEAHQPGKVPGQLSPMDERPSLQRGWILIEPT